MREKKRGFRVNYTSREGLFLSSLRNQTDQNSLPGKTKAEVVHSLILSIDLRYLFFRFRWKQKQREEEVGSVRQLKQICQVRAISKDSMSPNLKQIRERIPVCRDRNRVQMRREIGDLTSRSIFRMFPLFPFSLCD